MFTENNKVNLIALEKDRDYLLRNVYNLCQMNTLYVEVLCPEY